MYEICASVQPCTLFDEVKLIPLHEGEEKGMNNDKPLFLRTFRFIVSTTDKILNSKWKGREPALQTRFDLLDSLVQVIIHDDRVEVPWS